MVYGVLVLVLEKTPVAERQVFLCRFVESCGRLSSEFRFAWNPIALPIALRGSDPTTS